MEFVISKTVRELRQAALAINTQEVNPNTGSGLRACVMGREIWLPGCVPSAFLRLYWHELGHIISRDLSFREGQVLTPDQVKSSPRIFTKAYSEVILDMITHNIGVKRWSPFLIECANRVLWVFTEGNFNTTSVTLNTDVPLHRIDNLIRNNQGRSNNVMLEPSGDLVARYSPRVRDVELGALATEIGCLWLLENQLKELIPSLVIDYETSGLPSHDIALKLIARAYKRTGYIIPSLKDINEETTPSS